MVQYMCRGECKGTSDKPGRCQDKACSRHGLPLEVRDNESHAGDVDENAQQSELAQDTQK